MYATKPFALRKRLAKRGAQAATNQLQEWADKHGLSDRKKTGLEGELPPGMSVRSRSGVVGEGGEGGGGQGETLALEVEGDEPPDPKDTSY